MRYVAGFDNHVLVAAALHVSFLDLISRSDGIDVNLSTEREVSLHRIVGLYVYTEYKAKDNSAGLVNFQILQPRRLSANR